MDWLIPTPLITLASDVRIQPLPHPHLHAMKYVQIAAGLLIVVCAISRFVSTLHSAQAPPPNRYANISPVSKSTDRFQILAFDTRAPVFLGPGRDGAPGIAGRDDGMPPDGIVDNLAELGAMNTDDQCLAPWDDGYDQMAGKPFVAMISRGTFVPVSESPQDNSNGKVRFVIHGDSPDDPWSWIVIP